MLTQCLPASPTGSEHCVGDISNDSVEDCPSQDRTGHNLLLQTQLLKESILYGNSSQQEQEHYSFKRGGELKQALALLLTELDVRVMSSLEAQKLSKTAGDALQTLIIWQDTKEVSYSQLGVRPILVLFENIKTSKEAYRLLHSLVVSSRPVPKPRGKASLHPAPQSALLEALRRGMETGDRILTFEPDPETKQNLDDVRRTTYRRLDSLEETIRELENTLIEIGGHPTEMTACPPEAKKPPVPPKPTSVTPATIQVHCATPAVQLPALFSHFWSFTFKLLVSAP